MIAGTRRLLNQTCNIYTWKTGKIRWKKFKNIFSFYFLAQKITRETRGSGRHFCFPMTDVEAHAVFIWSPSLWDYSLALVPASVATTSPIPPLCLSLPLLPHTSLLLRLGIFSTFCLGGLPLRKQPWTLKDGKYCQEVQQSFLCFCRVEHTEMKTTCQPSALLPYSKDTQQGHRGFVCCVDGKRGGMPASVPPSTSRHRL